MTYEQIIEKLRGCLRRDKETRFLVGKLVGLALAKGKTYSEVAVDVDYHPGTLRYWHRTWQFWGDERLPDAARWSDYEWVANLKDQQFALEAKSRLLKRFSRQAMVGLHQQWYATSRPPRRPGAVLGGHLQSARNDLDRAATMLAYAVRAIREGATPNAGSVAEIERQLSEVAEMLDAVRKASRKVKAA